jgi:hypothetical protein
LSSFVPGERGAGEVDAILVDAESALILVIEMRWFLEPSEVREVADRERDGAAKAGQAQRKRDAVRRALQATLREIGVADAERAWTVEAVTVFDNYLPTPAGDEIPFVSHRAFISGIYQETALSGLWQWLQRGDWLPRRDVHFRVEPVDTTIGDICFLLDGVNPTDEGEPFVMARDARLLAAWGLRAP